MDHGRALRTGGGRRRGLGALLLLTCVEEEGRRGGGEAPWRGRGELLRGAMLKLAEGEGHGAERMWKEDSESLLEWIKI